MAACAALANAGNACGALTLCNVVIGSSEYRSNVAVIVDAAADKNRASSSATPYARATAPTRPSTRVNSRPSAASAHDARRNRGASGSSRTTARYRAGAPAAASSSNRALISTPSRASGATFVVAHDPSTSGSARDRAERVVGPPARISVGPTRAPGRAPSVNMHGVIARFGPAGLTSRNNTHITSALTRMGTKVL